MSLTTKARTILKDGYITNLGELYALADEYGADITETGYTYELEFTDGSKLVMYEDGKLTARN